jgi:hypothetical protein
MIHSLRNQIAASLLTATTEESGDAFGPPGVCIPGQNTVISLQARLDPGITVANMDYEVDLDASGDYDVMDSIDLVANPFNRLQIPGTGLHRLTISSYTGNDATKTIDTVVNSGAVRAANVVTIKCTAAHGFVVGQTVVIAGVTNTSFNGSFVIATQNGDKEFTYAQTGAGATSGSGTATVATSLEVIGVIQ